MAALNKYLNNKFLKTLEPLSKLSVDKLSELANKSTVETIPAGRTIFRQGEKDKRSYYLVSGQIELQTTGIAKAEIIKSKTPETKYPVSQQIPRPHTAKTKVNSEILSIDTDLLEMLLESDDSPSGNYEVTEINTDDENGWMLKFLQSRAFLQIPTENIQKILMSMEEISAKKGQTIVTQGENNDYYYIVKNGKCSVSRRPSPNTEDVQIAILAAGDGFGEEALITDGVRNATVRMLDNGTLMRLTKEDFMSLLVTPLLDYIHMDELKSRVNAGDLLVDVRQHKEFMDNHLEGAVNTPLSMIRLKLNNFNAERDTIVYCDDASRSTAAAFLLIQNGISCSILKNGLNNHPAAATTQSNKSSTSMTNIIANLDAVTNKEKPVKPARTKVTETKTEQAQKIAEDHSVKIKQQIDALNKKHSESESARKQILAEKQKLAAEKKRLEEEAQTLREKAETEKLAAQRELDRLAKETEKHKQAIEAKKKAEQEAQALKEKAETEKLAAQRETEKRKQALEAKQKAEQEAQNLKEKVEAEKLAAQRELEKQRKLTEESQRKIKQETEKIRQQADMELADLRKELQKTRSSVEDRVKLLKEKEKQKAEEEIRNRQQHANDAIKESIEKARQQAAEEAEKVRQQALQEAQRLQQEIELKKQKLETEAEKIRLEAEQERAATLELARKQAEEIVSRTTEEAELINSQRQELTSAAEQIRLQAEAERQATIEAAKQEAHDIVRKTAEDAQQLELQRQRIEEEVTKLKSEAELEKHKTLTLAKKEAEKIRLETEKITKQKILKEVEQVRKQTLKQAEELKLQRQHLENEAKKEIEQQRSTMEINLKQAEEIRMQAEKEAERIRLEALQQASEEIIVEDVQETDSIEPPSRSFSGINIPGSLSQQADDQKASMAESEAKSLAREIVFKLEKAESKRIKEQHETNHNSGLSLASASLKRRTDGKIVLDGEEDIFIFKEPKEVSNEELKELEASIDDIDKKELNNVTPIKSGSNNQDTELPEFTVEEPEFDLVDEIPSHLINQNDSNDVTSEFSDFELHQPSDIRSSSRAISKRPKQKIVAVAASLFVAIGVGITFLGINSEQGSTLEVAQQENNSFDATRVSGLATNNVEIDKKVINDAEKEFEKLLSKWKKTQQQESTSSNTEPALDSDKIAQ